MEYVAIKTDLKTTDKDELKALLKDDNFGILKFKAEVEYAGITVTSVNVEIRRAFKNNKPENTVETSVGVTLPRGCERGLRKAYKALQGKISDVEYWEMNTVEY